MEKEINKALSQLKENDEFYEDKRHDLQKALELVKDSKELFNRVNKMPTREYELVNVEFKYIHTTYKAKARFYLSDQSIEDIKVAKKDQSYIERFSLSDKLYSHLVWLAELEFKKLFEI